MLLPLQRLALPCGDVALLGGEAEAHEGDGAAVEAVLPGIAAVTDLLEGGGGDGGTVAGLAILGAVILQLHDIYALRHEQCDVRAALC